MTRLANYTQPIFFYLLIRAYGVLGCSRLGQGGHRIFAEILYICENLNQIFRWNCKSTLTYLTQLHFRLAGYLDPHFYN